MKKIFRFISTIMNKLFLPLTVFFLVLLLFDGSGHSYISPFVIISDLVIIIVLCAIAFFIQEELHNTDTGGEIPRTHQYITYISSIIIAVVVAIQSLYLPAIQNAISSIVALAAMLLVLHITQNQIQTYHKWTLIGVCVLTIGIILSLLSSTEGFIIFDFWNHYNNSKAFALSGNIDFLLLSYHAFYILLGSILSLAGTDIAVAQWLYGIGVALIFIFGSYTFYFIGKKLDHPKFGVLSAVFFILLPATQWGGLAFFIPNTLSLILWPLLFFFGLKKRTWQTITLFSLACLGILLYHPWDLIVLLPIFIIWKVSIHNKVHGYPLWIFMTGALVLLVEIVLYIFFPEEFFFINSFFPNFSGIYNDVISSISSEANFNQQVLFTLKNIPLIPFALFGAITVIIEYIKQRRSKKVLKLTEFLISQTFIFIALLIFAGLFIYNFRIVVFILFVSIPLASYCIYILSKKHWLLGGIVSSLLIGVLMMQNMYAYSQIGNTEYSSRSEHIGIAESIEKIHRSSVILTDPYSTTFISALSNHFNIHYNSNHEAEYLDIFTSPRWSVEQLAYLQKWDIEYIAVTNRTIEWARTGVATTATNDYVESLDSFVATKKQIRKKLRSVFGVVYSNGDFALYKVDSLHSIPVE